AAKAGAGAWVMNMRIGLIAFSAWAGAMLTPVLASAYESKPLQFCNMTNYEVMVSTGYHSPGFDDPADHSILTGPFVSGGWAIYKPGQCHELSNPFNARYMFWYAFSYSGINIDVEKVSKMRTSDSSVAFCVPNYIDLQQVPAFTYEEENASLDACDKAGDRAAGGRGKTLWVIPHRTDTWVDPHVNFTGE
ncbi:MAG TPA: DUF1036 domain-containing protein, partial [Caulobacteraceae bacterium]